MDSTLDVAQIGRQLYDFICANIFDPVVGFDENSRLAELGMDSYGFVELVLFIERRFGIVLPQECLNRENLESIASLARCVCRIQSSSPDTDRKNRTDFEA